MIFLSYPSGGFTFVFGVNRIAYSVPEPGVALLALAGLLALATARR